MAENALEKPFITASLTVLPSASSSLIRSNIITLASTAIPIESIIPDIPGKVNVMFNPFINISSKAI